jgi:hypothetical protein
MAQHLPKKYKALSSIPSAIKKGKMCSIAFFQYNRFTYSFNNPTVYGKVEFD